MHRRYTVYKVLALPSGLSARVRFLRAVRQALLSAPGRLWHLTTIRKRESSLYIARLRHSIFDFTDPKQNNNDRDEDDLLSVKDLLSSKCEPWIDLTGDSDYEVCHHVYEIRVITDTDFST